MCLNLQSFNGALVPCTKCYQCKEDRKNSLIGQCIAEQHVSDVTLAVTLTYANANKLFERDYGIPPFDIPQELYEKMYSYASANCAALDYKDPQNFLKRLRYYTSARVRYIISGEMGELKGRAHYHAVLFFKDRDRCTMKSDCRCSKCFLEGTQVELEKRMWFKPWIHGKVFFQEPDYKGFQYLLKYALKDEGYGTRNAMMSKGVYRKTQVESYGNKYYQDGTTKIIEGPLGHDYFQAMAKEMAEKGIPIQNYMYEFDGVYKRNGKRRKFAMTGATKKNFAKKHAEIWENKYGDKALTRAMSWYADRYLEKDQGKVYICPFIAKKDKNDTINGPWMVYYDQEHERNFVRDKYQGRKLVATQPVLNLVGKEEEVTIKVWGQNWHVYLGSEPMVKVGGTWQSASVEEVRYLLENGSIVNRTHIEKRA
jgi:hypothetical protein